MVRLSSGAICSSETYRLPWRKIVDNVVLRMELHHMPRSKARREAESLLADFGLKGFEDAYPAMPRAPTVLTRRGSRHVYVGVRAERRSLRAFLLCSRASACSSREAPRLH